MQLSFTRQKMLTSDFALQDWLPGEMDASPPGRSTPAGAGGRLPRTQARPAILLFLATSNDSELRVTEISGDMSHYTICGDLRRTAGLGRGLVILWPPLWSPHMRTAKAGWWRSVRWHSNLSAAVWWEEREPHTHRAGRISNPHLLGYIHWRWQAKEKRSKPWNFTILVVGWFSRVGHYTICLFCENSFLHVVARELVNENIVSGHQHSSR